MLAGAMSSGNSQRNVNIQSGLRCLHPGDVLTDLAA
jgi:hypothetical protein